MRTLVLTRSRDLPAPLSVVWEIVCDLDGYHRHAPSLADSMVIVGGGEGARRRCVDVTGASWEETCTRFAAMDSVVIDVDVSTYPVKFRGLFTAVRGTWSVAPISGGTRVELRFDLTLRRLLNSRAPRHALTSRFGPEMDAILASYAEQVVEEVARAAG